MIEIEGIPYLTVPETAARLGCSHQWVRYLISHGGIPALRIDQRRMVISEAEVARYEAYRPTRAAPKPVEPAPATPRKRGRPFGSKNKVKPAPVSPATDPDEVL
jgi:excisionase family DNA binding protein